MAKKGIALALVILLAMTIPLGIPLASGATYHNLTGYVTFEDGAPVSGALVEAVNATDTTVADSFTSSSDGSYLLTVPHGTYDVKVTLANYSGETYRFVISENMDNVNFTMVEVLGTVSGYITDGTAPVVGVTVTLKSKTAEFSGNSTIPLGQYTITNVTPGIYVAEAHKEGYQNVTYSLPLEVERGVVARLDFEIKAQPDRLYGKVTFGGAPLEWVLVSVSRDSSEVAQAHTDAQGDYSISGLADGNYIVTFSKDGYETTTKSVSLSSSGARNLNVALEADDLINGGGFIPGYDLPHSLMIVGFILALVMVSIALFIRFKVSKKPDLLPPEEMEESD